METALLPETTAMDNDDFYDLTGGEDELPSTQPKSVKTQNGPGNVRTKGKFTVHTQIAHRLFFGRKRAKGIEPIIGLVQFSSKINLIYVAASNGDPYADYRLIQIEDALSNALEIVKKNDSDLSELLGNDINIEILPSESVEPESLEIEFKTPYGYLGVRLLSSFDQLVLKALAARHAALIFNDDWKQFVNLSARKIRHALSLADAYRFSGASRDDFAANNQRATEAIEKFGELPPEVIDGTKRAKSAPKIRAHD